MSFVRARIANEIARALVGETSGKAPFKPRCGKVGSSGNCWCKISTSVLYRRGAPRIPPGIQARMYLKAHATERTWNRPRKKVSLSE